MVIGASKEVYSLAIMPSIPLKADNKITIDAVQIAIPTTEILEIMLTIDRLERLNRYRFAMCSAVLIVIS